MDKVVWLRRKYGVGVGALILEMVLWDEVRLIGGIGLVHSNFLLFLGWGVKIDLAGWKD